MEIQRAANREGIVTGVRRTGRSEGDSEGERAYGST